jgi:hypothetical protein
MFTEGDGSSSHIQALGTPHICQGRVHRYYLPGLKVLSKPLGTKGSYGKIGCEQLNKCQHEHRLPALSLGIGLSQFFLKGPDSDHLRFCGPRDKTKRWGLAE